MASGAGPAVGAAADPVALALGNLAVGLFTATAEVARLWQHPPIGPRRRL